MVKASRILMLNWPLVLTTTGILYVLVILCLPFSTVYATIFLFAIIAFWSRLPGVGAPPPFYFILYLADVIDVFSVIIAVNIGPVQAGVFSLLGNMWSRLCGAMPPEWGGVISDSLSQFIGCLIIPLFHAALGSNILITVTLYSVFRLIFVIPLDQIFYRVPWPRYLMEMVGGSILLFAINAFYTKLFGGFINSLLQAGVQFSWILFLFTSAVILVFYLAVFRSTESISLKPVLQSLARMLRRRFVQGKRMKYEDKDSLKEMDDFKEIKRSL